MVHLRERAPVYVQRTHIVMAVGWMVRRVWRLLRHGVISEEEEHSDQVVAIVLTVEPGMDLRFVPGFSFAYGCKAPYYPDTRKRRRTSPLIPLQRGSRHKSPKVRFVQKRSRLGKDMRGAQGLYFDLCRPCLQRGNFAQLLPLVYVMRTALTLSRCQPPRNAKRCEFPPWMGDQGGCYLRNRHDRRCTF